MEKSLLSKGIVFRQLLVLLFLAVGQFAMAQTTVTGRVIDGDGIGLPGVNVVEAGTTNAAVTDIDGNYTISVPSDAELQFTYIGYSTQTVPVAGQSTINITMELASELIDEVVVTGYQSQRKRDITGAVSVIESDDLNVVPAASLNQKLAGKAAGVTVSTSGSPGDGAAIRVRGFNSLLNNDPLIVIDGVQTKDVFLNSINPNDIESIQVLKDAASASIYGARSSNGVIVITTKKGKAGKTKITLDSYYGVQNPVNKFDLIIDPAEYREFTQAAALATAGGEVPEFYQGSTFPEFIHGDPSQPYSWENNNIIRSNTQGTDWWDEVFDAAGITEHNLGISGGTENSTFSVSGNYFNQQGTITNTYFERFMARANSTFNVGRFSFGENISLSRINQIGNPGGNQSEQNTITNIIRAQSIVPVLDEGGQFAGPKRAGLGIGNNPAKQLDDDKDDDGNFNRVFGNVFGQVKLIDGLSLRTSMGFDWGTGFTQNATFPNFEAQEVTQRTLNYSEGWSRNFTYLSTTTLNFNKAVGEKHNFNGVLGYEASRTSNRNIGAGLVDYFVFGIDSRYINTGLADPNTRSVGSGGSAFSFASIFGKVDYSYDDWLLLSGTVRRDGSSRFAEANRYGVFPAGSIGIRLTKWLQQDYLDDLKVRLSYGISGNDAIRSDNAFSLFGGGTGSSFYDIGGGNNIATGYALVARGNPEGKWEELEQFNFGLDASLWAGKLNFVLDIYSKETNDLLFTSAEPGTGGSAAPAAKNIASMTNKGFDLALNYQDNISSDLGFSVGLNLGHYRNEITRISDSQTQFFSNTGTRIGLITINRVGEPIGSFFGWETDGIFASSQEVESHADQAGKAVGRIRFKDLNNDGVVNDDDKTILGNFHPDLTGGLRIGLNYGNFDFSSFFFASIGNEIWNFNKVFTDFFQFESNVSREVASNFWSTSNPDSNIPAPDAAGRPFNNQPSDYYVEDGSYLRAESLQLGYTFNNLPNLEGSARVYIQGQNLFTVTGYSGLDPAMSNFGRADVSAGVDFGNYPSNKAIIFGVNFKL